MVSYKEEIISFLSGGGVVAIARLIIFIISNYREKSSAKAIRDVKWLYEQLNLVRAKAKCDCVWVGRTSNGGGIPRLGHSVYHNVPYIVGPNELSKSASHMFLQGQLASLLSRIIASHVTISSTALLTCEFMTELKKWKVPGVMLFHLKLTKRNFFYLGIGLSEDKRMPSAQEQQEIISICKKISARLS